MKGCVQWNSVYGWEDFTSSEDQTRSARSVGQRLTHWATGAPWPLGYKTFSMLNSTEFDIFPAHKCWNANKCLHVNIYERKNSILGLSEHKNAEFLDIFILMRI